MAGSLLLCQVHNQTQSVPWMYYKTFSHFFSTPVRAVKHLISFCCQKQSFRLIPLWFNVYSVCRQRRGLIDVQLMFTFQDASWTSQGDSLCAAYYRLISKGGLIHNEDRCLNWTDNRHSCSLSLCLLYFLSPPHPHPCKCVPLFLSIASGFIQRKSGP